MVARAIQHSNTRKALPRAVDTPHCKQDDRCSQRYAPLAASSTAALTMNVFVCSKNVVSIWKTAEEGSGGGDTSGLMFRGSG